MSAVVIRNLTPSGLMFGSWKAEAFVLSSCIKALGYTWGPYSRNRPVKRAPRIELKVDAAYG